MSVSRDYLNTEIQFNECIVDSCEMWTGASSDAVSSPFTALSLTTAIIIFTITTLITVFCIVACRCTRRHTKTVQPMKPAPRHLVTGSGTTALGGGKYTAGYLPTLQSPTPISEVRRPPSFYQTVCSDTVCPTMKSSWASTAVPLSQLWSASQLGSRRTSTFPSRQIQPITLHYYNDF